MDHHTRPARGSASGAQNAWQTWRQDKWPLVGRLRMSSAEEIPERCPRCGTHNVLHLVYKSGPDSHVNGGGATGTGNNMEQYLDPLYAPEFK